MFEWGMGVLGRGVLLEVGVGFRFWGNGYVWGW